MTILFLFACKICFCSNISFGIDTNFVYFQSLKSRAFVNEQFAWRHYYWYLTNEGIQYLRDFLHLPSEIVPATLKRQTRTEATRGPRPKGEYCLCIQLMGIFLLLVYTSAEFRTCGPRQFKFEKKSKL